MRYYRRYTTMEKSINAIETKLDSIFRNTSSCIIDSWKKEEEKFCGEIKAHKQKIIELEKKNMSLNIVIAAGNTKLEAQEKTIKSLEDKNLAQSLEIDFIHKKLAGLELQIDILEAEKKSLDARFNEVNLKLKQQRQASDGEIPPLIPDQVENEIKKEHNYSVPLINTPQSNQVKNLKRPAETSEGETEPESSPSSRERKRYVCGVCLENWYQQKWKAPRNIVKTFATWSRLENHFRGNHPDKCDGGWGTLLGAGALCDSNCTVSIAPGETKPKKFKCTALIDSYVCHKKFKCRYHYDRHIEIDHANIAALDKYSLADLYEKHFKK